MAGLDGPGVRPELHKETGADTPRVRSVPLDESSEANSKKILVITEPCTSSSSPSTTNKIDRLVSIMKSSESNVSTDRSETGPKIQRVPDLLRKNHRNMQLFEPEVVALGPFHYDNAHLKPMDEHKKVAAKHFVEQSDHSIEQFYNMVGNVASKARECYSNMPKLGDEDFVDMLFFDGCFLLQFTDLIIKGRSSELTMSIDLQGSIMKDMFLLENQIPFIVLKALMTLKYVDLEYFMDNIIIGSNNLFVRSRPDVEQETIAPYHLLDLLRTRFLGPKEVYPGAYHQILDSLQHQVRLLTPKEVRLFLSSLRTRLGGQKEVRYPGGANWETLRTVMELKEEGIMFKKSESYLLRDIEFNKGFVRSWISLPSIVVNDLTRSRFLNLIALEMCLGSLSDYGISSYILLMDQFIDHPEDVKELRSRGILLNALGSDEQVANLFNELARWLSPAPEDYIKVIRGIRKHYESRFRTSRVTVVRILNTHFSSPWSTVVFLAAVFLTALTVIQTIFTVWPRNQTDSPSNH